MAGSTVDIGHGCTVAFATTAFTASIESITVSGVTRSAIDTSHMGTTATTSGGFGSRTFIPEALSDAGEMGLTIQFNPQTVVPIDLAAEQVTLTWPLVVGDSTPATWVFSGFMTGYSNEASFEDKMMADVTVKISGKVTETAAA